MVPSKPGAHPIRKRTQKSAPLEPILSQSLEGHFRCRGGSAARRGSIMLMSRPARLIRCVWLGGRSVGRLALNGALVLRKHKGSSWSLSPVLTRSPGSRCLFERPLLIPDLAAQPSSSAELSQRGGHSKGAKFGGGKKRFSVRLCLVRSARRISIREGGGGSQFGVVEKLHVLSGAQKGHSTSGPANLHCKPSGSVQVVEEQVVGSSNPVSV